MADPKTATRIPPVPRMATIDSATAIPSRRPVSLAMRSASARKTVATTTAPNSIRMRERRYQASRNRPTRPRTISVRRMNWRSLPLECGFATLCRRPLFKDFNEPGQPGVGLVAVDDAVVDGQGDIGHRQDDNRVLA